MRYIPHTEDDIRRMLKLIGADSVDDLFSMIPESLRISGNLPIPEGICEAELRRDLSELGHKNQAPPPSATFAGAGLYPHTVPAVVDSLSFRSEFYTAYTPYQPELSQGTLLAIFEYQTIVAEMMGMEMSNASMYDGASAMAEAMLMARRLTRRNTTVLAGGIHPEYEATCATYLSGLDPNKEQLRSVPLGEDGRVDCAAVAGTLDKTVAAVIVQSPNVFGILEDIAAVAEVAHAAGALLIAVCPEPLALALMASPGEAGADIAVGEGIGLAGPANLGGPGVGLLATSGKKAMRNLPGRVVGQTVDQDGRPGYVLTLSTREQHIRRERATSNICTNHGLIALRFAIHMSLLGKTGFVQLARLNLGRALYAKKVFAGLEGYALAFDGPCFNELALTVPGPSAEALVERASRAGLVPGVAASRVGLTGHPRTLLVAVNEQHRQADIDHLASELAQCARAEQAAGREE